MSTYLGTQLLAGIATETISNAHSLFDFMWSDHIKNEMSWLRADTFSWQDGTVYVAAYNHLLSDIDGKTTTSETVGSYTISYYLADDGHKITTDEATVADIYAESGVAWYYILDTANQRFKLPRENPNREVLGMSAPVVFDGNIAAPSGFTKTNALDGDKIVFNGYSINPITATTITSDKNGVAGDGIFNGQSVGIDADLSLTTGIYKGNKYLYFYVGQFSQSAVEQTAGITTTQLGQKVDLDAENLSDAGKSLIAGLGMPSDTYEELTLGASWTEYVADSNGYVCLSGATTSSTNYQYGLYNKTARFGSTQRIAANGVNFDCFIPVLKGQTFLPIYEANLANASFKFIYAKGSESEAS